MPWISPYCLRLLFRKQLETHMIRIQEILFKFRYCIQCSIISMFGRLILSSEPLTVSKQPFLVTLFNEHSERTVLAPLYLSNFSIAYINTKVFAAGVATGTRWSCLRHAMMWNMCADGLGMVLSGSTMILIWWKSLSGYVVYVSTVLEFICNQVRIVSTVRLCTHLDYWGEIVIKAPWLLAPRVSGKCMYPQTLDAPPAGCCI